MVDEVGSAGLEREKEMFEGIRTRCLYFSVGRVHRVLLPVAPPPVPPGGHLGTSILLRASTAAPDPETSFKSESTALVCAFLEKV